MTNAMIILFESVKLMEQGIIEGTGRTVEIVDAEGNTKELEEPESIHTFATWKKLGYVVKKGEHSIARFPIWKYTSKKVLDDNKQVVLDEEGNEMTNDKMIMKTASFFKASQVERIVK